MILSTSSLVNESLLRSCWALVINWLNEVLNTGFKSL